MKIIERIFLKMMLRRLEEKIGTEFDPSLSLRIDAIRYLLENQE